MLNSPRLNNILTKSDKLVRVLSIKAQKDSRVVSLLYVQNAQDSSSSSSKSLNWLIHANREKESDWSPHDRAFCKGHYYHEKVIMGYSREQMCTLVANVAKYREFVPFCVDSQIVTDKPSRCPNDASPPSKNKINLNLLNKNKKAGKELLQQLQQTSNTKSQNQQSFRAVLEIGYPPIKESYMSYVSVIRPEIVKSISRDTNLFEYLINEWKFHPYDITSSPDKNQDGTATLNCPHHSACIVEFYVAFKFRSILYSQFSGLFMDQIFKQMVKAFTKRAQQMYGPPSVPLSKLNESKGGGA